jgi:hypothetical protein
VRVLLILKRNCFHFFFLLFKWFTEQCVVAKDNPRYTCPTGSSPAVPCPTPPPLPALASFEDQQHNVCVTGNNIVWLYNMSPESCARKCLDYGNSCVGIEYFYVVRECILASSTNTDGCPGASYQIDWYKRKMGGEDESLLELEDGSAFDEMYE